MLQIIETLHDEHMDEARRKRKLILVEDKPVSEILLPTETLYEEHMDEARPNPMHICTEVMQSCTEIERGVSAEHGLVSRLVQTICMSTLFDFNETQHLYPCVNVVINETQRLKLGELYLHPCVNVVIICWVETGSEMNTVNRLNRMNTTRIKPSQHDYEIYDDNVLHTEQAFVWYKPFNLEKRKEDVKRLIYCETNYRRIVEPLNIPGDYVTQKHKDREYFITLKYGTNKCVEIDGWDGKMTLQLQDKSTYCNPNMYVELDEPFNLEKRKQAVQRVSSFVIVTTAFLWIITDICGQLSPIQLQQEHGSLFIWSSLLEILAFMAFVCAILAMIVVGARWSHLQRIMLIFWAIWMQVKSAKSLTAVSPPILGILFTGWHVLMEKQPPHEE